MLKFIWCMKTYRVRQDKWGCFRDIFLISDPIRPFFILKCAPSVAVQMPIFHVNIQKKSRFSKDEK